MKIISDSTAPSVNTPTSTTTESAAVETAESIASSSGPREETSLLSANNSPITPNTPKDCESLIEAAFKHLSIVHSQYTCTKNSCLNLSTQEVKRLKTDGAKDRFWLLYEEGVGMFCLLCKKHNAVNLQNKFKKFNTDPSVRYKHTAIVEHGNSQQHKASVEAELTRRSSAFHKQVEQREQSRDVVKHNAFLMLYWLAKEEMPNKMFTSLLDLTERLGQVDMKFFQHRSAGVVREMFLLLGQMVQSDVAEKIKHANTFGLLTDEVCDITKKEQLVTFIKYVDVDTSKASTQFIAIDDLLKDSNSANSTTVKNTVMKQLNECGLDVKKLSGLATDGCSVMTGKRNGVSVQLRPHCFSMSIVFVIAWHLVMQIMMCPTLPPLKLS